MANDLNVVVLIGRLTRDCEKKSTQTGMTVVNFSLAVNRRVKSGDQWTDEGNFFDVSLLGKSADSLAPYLTKGKQVSVQGSLRQRRWEKDGQNYSKVEILADTVSLLGGSTAPQGQGSPVQSAQAPQQTTQKPGRFTSMYGNNQQIQQQPRLPVDSNKDDDIPF